MTWLGVDQTNMYSAWLPIGSDVFDATQGMPFTSYNAPVITYDQGNQEFLVVWRGVSDSRIYLSQQDLGSDFWDGAQALTGLTTPTSPTIAQTGVPVWISVIASVFYIVVTSGQYVEWKQGWNANSGI